MSDAQSNHHPTLDEAAAWFARLNQPTVTHADLADFRAWRATAANANAYSQVEALWGQAMALANDPDIRGATARIGRRSSPWLWFSRAWALLFRRPVLGLGLAVAVGMVATVGVQATMGTRYETAVGEQRVLRLADGSRLHLDTDSEVRVRLSRRARDIELVRGQAMFEVAHDASRPFTVAADGTTVRALGTQFDVRRLASGAKVTLIEGRVEVRNGTAGAPRVWALRPGEQVTTGKVAVLPRQVDVSAATSWTKGQLVFRDVPLSVAIAEFNRYSAQPIELKSETLGAERVSGVFDSNDTDAFLAAVTNMHPLRQDERAGGGVILRPATDR
ncbi:MAG: FecR family protein [Caulobacter sp.]|nr:FecR family protein [Caulobacter sp.]